MTRSQIIEVMAMAMTPDPDGIVFAVGGTGQQELHDILYAWNANKPKAEAALTALESTMSNELKAAWEKEMNADG